MAWDVPGYRVEDMVLDSVLRWDDVLAEGSTATGYQARGLTKKAISKYRARELQMEAFPGREHVLCGPGDAVKRRPCIPRSSRHTSKSIQMTREPCRGAARRICRLICSLLLTGCSEHFASESR